MSNTIDAVISTATSYFYANTTESAINTAIETAIEAWSENITWHNATYNSGNPYTLSVDVHHVSSFTFQSNNPAGLELITPTLDNTIEDNWKVPTLSPSLPGQMNGSPDHIDIEIEDQATTLSTDTYADGNIYFVQSATYQNIIDGNATTVTFYVDAELIDTHAGNNELNTTTYEEALKYSFYGMTVAAFIRDLVGLLPYDSSSDVGIKLNGTDYFIRSFYMYSFGTAPASRAVFEDEISRETRLGTSSSAAGLEAVSYMSDGASGQDETTMGLQDGIAFDPLFYNEGTSTGVLDKTAVPELGGVAYSDADRHILALFGIQDAAYNCMAPGMKVEIPSGFKFVENIKEGDIVIDIEGNDITVVNLLKFISFERPVKVLTIKKDAFGPGQPYEDFKYYGGHPIKFKMDQDEILPDDDIIVNNELCATDIEVHDAYYCLSTEKRTFISVNGIFVCTWDADEFEEHKEYVKSRGTKLSVKYL